MAVKQFQRPNNVKSGILLNTDNKALADYKRMKRKMNRIEELESQVAQLTSIVADLSDKYNNGSK